MIRRTDARVRNVKNLVLTIAASGLLVGCQVPGGSFGREPMQLRFAEMTCSALAVEDAGPTSPYAAPVRPAGESIAVAAHESWRIAN